MPESKEARKKILMEKTENEHSKEHSNYYNVTKRERMKIAVFDVHWLQRDLNFYMNRKKTPNPHTHTRWTMAWSLALTLFCLQKFYSKKKYQR